MAQPILLIGAGRMGGALLKGWLEAGIGPIDVIEPQPSGELRKLRRKVRLLRSLDQAERRYRACVIALKPQVLKTEAGLLRPVAESGALMLSIAAGTTIVNLRKAWGGKARIVRAMPNTPGAIGRGITGLFAAKRATASDKALAEKLLGALGETVWVRSERDIDIVTAVSGSGPAYVFLLVEALAAAGEAQGLPRDIAEQLARATVAGSGALLDADPAPAAELRRNVTSPGGTTEAALRVLMAKQGLAKLMQRAVAAAARRAKVLGA